MSPVVDSLASNIASERTSKQPLWLYLVTDRRCTRRTHEVAQTIARAKELGAARLGLHPSEVITTRVRLFGSES